MKYIKLFEDHSQSYLEFLRNSKNRQNELTPRQIRDLEDKRILDVINSGLVDLIDRGYDVKSYLREHSTGWNIELAIDGGNDDIVIKDIYDELMTLIDYMKSTISDIKVLYAYPSYEHNDDDEETYEEGIVEFDNDKDAIDINLDGVAYFDLYFIKKNNN